MTVRRIMTAHLKCMSSEYSETQVHIRVKGRIIGTHCRMHSLAQRPHALAKAHN